MTAIDCVQSILFCCHLLNTGPLLDDVTQPLLPTTPVSRILTTTTNQKVDYKQCLHSGKVKQKLMLVIYALAPCTFCSTISEQKETAHSLTKRSFTFFTAE